MKKILDLDGNANPLPKQVGEIDLVMFDAARQVISVLEVKRIQPTYVPSQFRDDVSKFFSGKHAYVDQLKRKIGWVRAHLQQVMQHLAAKGLLDLRELGAVRLEGAIITKNESFAQVRDQPVPVVSLRRLIEQRRTSGNWQFADISD